MRLVVLLLLSLNAFAMSEQEARNIGNSLGSSLRGNLENNASNSAPTIVPGYETSSPPQVNLDSSNIESAKEEALVDSEEGQLIYEGVVRRPQIEITGGESFMTNSRQIENNPESLVDNISGHYDDCNEQGGEVITTDELRTCDAVLGTVENHCDAGKVVNVDPSYIYQCERSRKEIGKSCRRDLLLTCTETDACYYAPANSFSVALRGYQYGSVRDINNSHGLRNYSNNIFRFRARGDHDQNGCNYSEARLRLNIPDKSKLRRVVLSNIYSYDHLYIELNGQKLYSHPHANASKFAISIVGGRNHLSNSIDLGFAHKHCLSHIATSHAVNIDLLPSLRNGNNDLVIKNFYSLDASNNVDEGNYQGIYGEIIVEGQCCSNWQEDWQEVCEGEG